MVGEKIRRDYPRMNNLEIGCGLRPHKGFKTFDVEAYAHPDYLGDFRTMEFHDVDCIRMHHVLEHFGRDEGVRVLKRIRSWLRVGGTFIVETPDFEEICKNFAVDPYWLTRHTFGSQEAEWAYHRDGWYEQKFKDILPGWGFSIQSIQRNKSRKILPNIIVTTTTI
jgi:hypothetical protein